MAGEGPSKRRILKPRKRANRERAKRTPGSCLGTQAARGVERWRGEGSWRQCGRSWLKDGEARAVGGMWQALVNRGEAQRAGRGSAGLFGREGSRVTPERLML